MFLKGLKMMKYIMHETAKAISFWILIDYRGYK